MEHVAGIFIECRRLNGNLLLGMSFLLRIRMTIHDENNRSILMNN
jgi:predicted aspartyl protease